MKTKLIVTLLALSITVACSSSSDGGGGGGDGSCSNIVVCTSIPSARVDQLCATKTTKTSPVDTTADPQINSCEYIGGSDSLALLSRVCTKAASNAKQTFDAAKNEPARGSDTKAPVMGLGDDAYVRVTSSNNPFAELTVLKGNKIFTLSSVFVAPQTADGIRTQCLVPLLNELVAL